MAINVNETDMDDVIFALNVAAKNHHGGISGLAKMTGHRPQTFINKLNPQDNSHQPTIGDLVMVCSQTGDTTPLDVLCNMFYGQFVTRTKEVEKNIVNAVLRAASESGDVMKAVERALPDGISDSEKLDIKREINEARKAFLVLENTLLKL